MSTIETMNERIERATQAVLATWGDGYGCAVMSGCADKRCDHWHESNVPKKDRGMCWRYAEVIARAALDQVEGGEQIHTARAVIGENEGETKDDAPPPLSVIYKNWRGIYALRNILPLRLWYGRTEYHPEDQWLLSAHDCDKGETRDFALSGFGRRAEDDLAHQEAPITLDQTEMPPFPESPPDHRSGDAFGNGGLIDVELISKNMDFSGDYKSAINFRELFRSRNQGLSALFQIEQLTAGVSTPEAALARIAKIANETIDKMMRGGSQ